MIVSTDSLLDCWKERNRKTLKVKMLNSFQNKFHGNHQSKKSQNRKNIKKKQNEQVENQICLKNFIDA